MGDRILLSLFVRLLAPLDYVSFVACMQRAYILLTDSGRIQEEGPLLGKPVLVMREVSERPEAIAAGTACLTGTDPEGIVGAVSSLLDDSARYKQMTSRPNPYSDGHAAERIVRFLISRMTSLSPTGWHQSFGTGTRRHVSHSGNTEHPVHP